jgi:hypothetical protein
MTGLAPLGFLACQGRFYGGQAGSAPKLWGQNTERGSVRRCTPRLSGRVAARQMWGPWSEWVYGWHGGA